jgi:succinyl-diaminopimelate desuccinylase
MMNLASYAVELTRRLIRFNTINPPGNERECNHYLGKLLEDAGFSVAYHEFADSRTTLIARRTGRHEKKPLCFTGHVDVVPLGARPWRAEPFAAEISDGKLFGRGSSDTKSGVAAFVAAALETDKALNQGPGVVMIITAGEETGSAGAFQVAALGTAVLGQAGAMVVAEPTGNYPFVGHKGALWLKARTRGRTAHASTPERGINAVYKAARLISKLEHYRFDTPAHPLMGSPTLSVGTVSGGVNVNSVPDYTEVGIDIRTPLGVDHAQLRSKLANYLRPELDELEATLDIAGVATDPAHPWVQEVCEIVRPFVGRQATPGAAPYFTDAGALTPAYGGVPTVILGPGEIEMAHQTDEFCYVSKIEQAAEVYRMIIERWQKA